VSDRELRDYMLQGAAAAAPAAFRPAPPELSCSCSCEARKLADKLASDDDSWLVFAAGAVLGAVLGWCLR
jgi:hypothetical protein